jgi:hypothetical protein
MERRRFLIGLIAAAGAAIATPTLALTVPVENIVGDETLIEEVRRGGRGGRGRHRGWGRGRGRAWGRRRGWGDGPRGVPFRGGGFCPPGQAKKGRC